MEEYKSKRTRIKPIRKWTAAEERLLINFLFENTDFEKPTAQVYYKRFIGKNSIQIDWKSSRSKVRNMRVSYNKAKAWKESQVDETTDEQTIKATLLKMCYFFDEFEEIFENRISKCSYDYNTYMHNNVASDLNGFIDSTEVCNENFTTKVEVENYTWSSSPLRVPEENSCIDNLPTKRKSANSKTTVSEILEFQKGMLQLKRERLELEKERLREELKIKEKELALKEAEQKSQERIKILELEMKERLAREELRLKYK